MLILDVWRDAVGGHSIAEAMERMAVRITRELPLKGLVLRRFEPERRRIETVAGAWLEPGFGVGVARRELEVEEFTSLLQWARRSGCGRAHAGSPAAVVAEGSGDEGEAVVCALGDGEVILGFAVGVMRDGAAIDAAALRIWSGLREPLAAALRVEVERQEIDRLRVALEEDKRALLTRLDRQEITGAIVGADGGLRGVLDRVEQVAGTDAPVLLLGETGSGKEVIAREIHRLSGRADGPVVKVNCGAIPAGLIDSELFGHERGSFTGAVQDRAGWFERADGGTLFLDEIGELPLDAQVRLLRVLQDGTFERVGGRRTHTVDVRIVAATHQDLHGMIDEGRFREDLWYRISVFPIRLPPLRERVTDIPVLAEHFAWGAGRRLGGMPLTLTPADVDLLVAYSWPGNVRELAAVIERAVILGNGHRVDVAAALGGERARRPGGEMPAGVAATAAATFAPLDEIIAGHMGAALRRSGGRIEGPGGAAALLGVNPHTLRSRMRRLGIDWTRFRVTARE